MLGNDALHTAQVYQIHSIQFQPNIYVLFNLFITFQISTNTSPAEVPLYYTMFRLAEIKVELNISPQVYLGLGQTQPNIADYVASDQTN